MILNKKIILPVLYIMALFVQTTRGQDKAIVSLPYNHYYTHSEIGDLLKSFVNKYPQFLKLESIGKSVQNREMWVVTINNPATGAEMDKPAMYIDANIHGNEVQGSETVLYTLDYLMTNYKRIDKVTKLVDERVFYLIPMVNPDGRMHWFDKKNFSAGGRSGMAPTDNDHDGLFDEDGYEDIDGDGYILRMRKKVSHGDYRISGSDPRLMERVGPDEEGDYILLGTEGFDNDGDGRINEDGAGGYDMNRNWPSDWQPEYIQYGSGARPLSYPETECIANFVLAHPNIAGVQSYHNSGGMILSGPGNKKEKYPAADRRVYDFIGREGEKILPFYKYMILWKDLYPVHGGFVNWAAEGLGIFSFTNELWSSDQYYNIQSSQSRNRSYASYTESQKKRLFFDDHVEMGNQFIEWKPFNHPDYGQIELGGWARETGRVPPMFMLAELCHRNTMFTLFHAEQMPKVEISDIITEKIGPDSYKIRAAIRNLKVIPTISSIGANKHRIRPDVLTLTGKNIKVVSAGLVRNKYLNNVSLIEKRPYRIEIPRGIPGKSEIIYQFIVSGKGNLKIKLDCIKGGKAEKIVRL